VIKDFIKFLFKENCSNLKTLILRDCIFVDDWFCTKVGRTFSDILVNLDLSNCKSVTDNGLIHLSYLK
jgi:hypothetical protein